MSVSTIAKNVNQSVTPASFSRARLSKAVALACLSLSGVPFTTAHAADVCGAGLTTINTAQAAADNCVLGAGDSVNVVAPGSLTGAGEGVDVGSGLTATSITNSGTISATSTGIRVINSTLSSGISNSGTVSATNDGIRLFNNGTVNGGITNNAGGTISGGSTGISVDGVSTVNGGIINNAGGTISGGTAGISVDTTSTISGGITNSGTITGGTSGIFIRNTGTISGGITNSGTVTGTSSAGIFVLSSTVTGGITNSGTISAGDIVVRVNNSNVDSISNSGTLSGGNHGVVVEQNAVVGSITNNAGGTISGGTSGIFLGTNATVSGSISNSGTISSGNLAINVSGNSTVTMGITNNTGGVINGRVSLLNGTNLTNAGTLSLPDNTTSTIGGNYTQTAGGLLEFGASSGSSFATVAVTGTADFTVSGALGVKVSANDTLVLGDVLSSVLTAGTLNAGALTVTDNSALFNFTAAVNGNAIDITTEQGLTVAQAVVIEDTPAGGGVAAVLDGFNAGNPAPTGDLTTVVNSLNSLSTTAEVANAAAQLTPSFSGGAATITLNLAGSGAAKVVGERTSQISGLASGGVVPNRYLWAQPFGSNTTQDERSGVEGYDADTVGIAIGTDAKMNGNWRVGGAVSYAQTDVSDSSAGLNESLELESYQATIYTSGKVLGDKYLNLQASLGFNDNESQRNITFGGLNREAKADFDSWQTHLAAELVYAPYAVGAKTTLTPVIGLDYAYVDVDSYTESGAGGANLRVQDNSEDSLVASVGGRLAHSLNTDTTLTAQLSVGHDFTADRSSLTSTFTGGGPSFTTDGLEPASTVVNAGVGFVMQTKSNLEITARYDIEARSDVDNQSLSVNLRWPF